MSKGGPPPYPYGFNLPPTQFVANGAPPLYPVLLENHHTSFPNGNGAPMISFPEARAVNMAAPPPVTNVYPPQRGQTAFISTASSTSFVPSAPSSQSVTWVQWRKGQTVPPNAVRGGFDVDKSEIFIGRLKHHLDLLPAKVIPQKNIAYAPYNGEEISYDHCEILCHQHPCWASSSNGQVPPGAILVGQTGTGESLYAARVQHEGSLAVGKVHPSHGVCYIPFGGKEIPFKTYEVLISLK